ncbi:MAG: hypothetical protein E7022_03015 [Desulfovibrio desulfuricans]|nr:hypothetical protein [Desulfovibrio desulfuricans]
MAINDPQKISFFIPDYYFVTAHGVGALSFVYYLSYLSAPTTILSANNYHESGKSGTTARGGGMT